VSTEFWITLAVTLTILGVLIVLVRELVLFATGRPPVTQVARVIIARHHAWALLVSHAVAFGLGFGVAHLIADR
jgi:hypothetical protein